MLANEMNEDEITPADILDHDEAKDARYFYIPVMLVRDWREETGRLQTAALLTAFLEHIPSTCVGPNTRDFRTLFFIGFTPEGISMARRLGPKKMESVTQYGATGRELYEVNLSPPAVFALDSQKRGILMWAIGLRTRPAAAQSTRRPRRRARACPLPCPWRKQAMMRNLSHGANQFSLGQSNSYLLNVLCVKHFLATAESPRRTSQWNEAV
jgi:hypothetical protein